MSYSNGVELCQACEAGTGSEEGVKFTLYEQGINVHTLFLLQLIVVIYEMTVRLVCNHDALTDAECETDYS